MLKNHTVSVSVDPPTGDVGNMSEPCSTSSTPINYSDKVDSLSHCMGSSGFDQTMEDVASSQPKPQRVNEEKMTAVHNEMQRMNQLPPTSSYVTHRLRVLRKVLQLLSMQRTVSQDEELELLFAGLHI